MNDQKLERLIDAMQRTVSFNIISLRQHAGLTQLQLAALAGIDRKTINRIENGHFAPSVDTLARLALVLNTTVSDLLN